MYCTQQVQLVFFGSATGWSFVSNSFLKPKSIQVIIKKIKKIFIFSIFFSALAQVSIAIVCFSYTTLIILQFSLFSITNLTQLLDKLRFFIRLRVFFLFSLDVSGAWAFATPLTLRVPTLKPRNVDEWGWLPDCFNLMVIVATIFTGHYAIFFLSL